MKLVLCEGFKLLMLTSVVENRTCFPKTKELKFAGALCFNFHFNDWDQDMIYVLRKQFALFFRIHAKGRHSKLFNDAEDRFCTSNFRGGMLCHAISVVIVWIKGLSESASLLVQCHHRILYLKN